MILIAKIITKLLRLLDQDCIGPSGEDEFINFLCCKKRSLGTSNPRVGQIKSEGFVPLVLIPKELSSLFVRKYVLIIFSAHLELSLDTTKSDIKKKTDSALDQQKYLAAEVRMCSDY